MVEAGASADELYAAIASAWASRGETRARLRAMMPEIRERAEAGARFALAPVVDEPCRANGEEGKVGENESAGRASVLGSPVDCISMDDAVAFLMERAASGVGAHVVTINPEMALSAVHDSELADAISRADLVVPDGIGVVRGLRILGYSPRKGARNRAGDRLDAPAASSGMALFLVGAEPGVADAAAERMASDIPGPKSQGRFMAIPGSRGEAVLSRIQDADPSFVLVGMGAGKQEKWIVKARKSAPSAVWIGVGGSFDVMSGNVKRAPVAFQKLGLEWFTGLLQSLAGQKRMTALPAFVFAVLGEAFRKGEGVDGIGKSCSIRS